MKMETITIKLTPHEAEWLRNALSIAASACAEPAPTLGRWAHAFALGLDAKIAARRTGKFLSPADVEVTHRP